MIPEELQAWKDLDGFSWGKGGGTWITTGLYSNGRAAVQVWSRENGAECTLTVNLVGTPLAPWHFHVKAEGFPASSLERFRCELTGERVVSPDMGVVRATLATLWARGIITAELDLPRIEQGFVAEYAATFALIPPNERT